MKLHRVSLTTSARVVRQNEETMPRCKKAAKSPTFLPANPPSELACSSCPLPTAIRNPAVWNGGWELKSTDSSDGCSKSRKGFDSTSLVLAVDQIEFKLECHRLTFVPHKRLHTIYQCSKFVAFCLTIYTNMGCSESKPSSTTVNNVAKSNPTVSE